MQWSMILQVFGNKSIPFCAYFHVNARGVASCRGWSAPGPGVLPFLPVVPKLPILRWVPNGKESPSRYLIYGGWIYHRAMYSHPRFHMILFLKYFIFLRGKENLFGLVWFGFPESLVSQLTFLGSVLTVRHIFTATVLGL